MNQIACTISRRNWTYSSDDANIFGLEPHFGCCTANLHQGWPKLVRALWYRRDNRLVSALLAPNTLSTTVEGVPVKIRLATDYPFSPSLRYQISTERPVRFELCLRLPGWCSEAEIQNSFDSEPICADGFASFDRIWKGTEQIRLELPFKPRLLNRPPNAVAIALGPLLMAYTPGEIWSRVPGSGGFGDFEVRARGSWNYGLRLDDISRLRPSYHPIANPPFQVKWAGRQVSAPVRLPVTGCLLPEWTAVDGSAGPVPKQLNSHWPEHLIDLVPYGCTRIRVAEFPYLLTPNKHPTP
ncbi:MAG: glycoside hydrolase family 127 protein [Verrucomicrobia bacterium]|nr:glycoside hydrolase family 127 protein [Verrucomicrobiota bacterium]